MTLKAALALWNIIDANHHNPSDDIASFTSNTRPKFPIKTLSTNAENTNTVDMHNISDIIDSTEYAILENLPSCVIKNNKDNEPELQLIRILQLDTDCIDNVNSIRRERKPQKNVQISEYPNNDGFKLFNPKTTGLKAASPQKLYYQGRNMLDLDLHLRTSWMSFNTSRMDCNNMSVEDFLLNRGQISRIVDIWPPESQLKYCPIKDCDFAECIYQ